jgi:hypothetical protein
VIVERGMEGVPNKTTVKVAGLFQYLFPITLCTLLPILYSIFPLRSRSPSNTVYSLCALHSHCTTEYSLCALHPLVKLNIPFCALLTCITENSALYTLILLLNIVFPSALCTLLVIRNIPFYALHSPCYTEYYLLRSAPLYYDNSVLCTLLVY